MTPVTININVNLGPETLEALGALASKAGVALRTAPKVGPEAAPAPAPAPAAKPAPATKKVVDPDPTDDLPAQIADPISDDQLIAAVAETKKKVPAKSIKDLFGKYDIPCSTKCPQEKRAALLADLKSLTDDAF